MNKDRVLALAAAVADPNGPEFNMISHETCFCGQARRLAGDGGYWGSTELCDWLGLPDTEERYELTSPSVTKLSEITREQAAATLRRLAETGKVDWQLP